MPTKFLKASIFITALLIFGAVSCTQSNNSNGFEKTIKFEKPKEGDFRYKYIPFEVPANTESISIIHEYDKKGGKNRIEFGIFDTKFSGEKTDKKGFRGWSGSVRDRVFIAKDSATHGYVAGEIESGKWNIILGLASVADEGVEVKLDIKFNQIDEKAEQQFEDEEKRTFSFKQNEKFERVKTGDLTWFAGDLHTHTFHGDGRWSVKGILESASSNNLDFVAITEHNTFTHHKEIKKESKDYPNILVLNGQEVTTYGGHINVWGLPTGEWIDFRVLPKKQESAQQISDEAEKFGAIASINHPTMDCGGCNWTYGDWENMVSVEIWNATWDKQDESALKQWDDMLQKGKMITAIGSSDSHQRPEEPSDYPTNLTIGEPTVFVGAEEKTKDILLEAIKNGKVFVAENSRRTIKFTATKLGNNTVVTIGDTLDFYKDYDSNFKYSIKFSLNGFPNGSKVKLISSAGIVKEFRTNSKIFSGEHEVNSDKSNYFRLEVRSSEDKMLAFTNPIYVRHWMS